MLNAMRLFGGRFFIDTELLLLADLKEEFREKGIQVDVLTEDQVALFKEKVEDVKAEFLAKFDESALAAFGIEG